MNHRSRHRENRDAASLERSADSDEVPVDFASAGLYLGAIQVIFVVTLTAFVSLAACWLSPEGGVSAVRTLALCVGTASVLLQSPLRVGRVRGVRLVFSALRWAAPVYILALVVEQLVHTCATANEHVPSWRHGLFGGATLVMLFSGVLSARKPLDDTDLPFLVTVGALLVIALIPPPAVALIGPLCQPVGIVDAAIRMVRAFTFSCLYAVHVYASTSPTAGLPVDMLVTVSKSSAAAVWTLTVHPLLLFAAIIQATIAIVSRITSNASTTDATEQPSKVAYKRVPEDITDDVEAGRVSPVTGKPLHWSSAQDKEVANGTRGTSAESASDEESVVVNSTDEDVDHNLENDDTKNGARTEEAHLLGGQQAALPFSVKPSIGPLKWQELSLPLQNTVATKQPMTQERLAQIAAGLEETGSPSLEQQH